MKINKIKTMSAVAIAAALLTIGAGTASAADWYVEPTGNDTNTCTAPGPTNACLTITGAMAKASAGDTIHVAIGLYNEQVQITKTLTLLGAQSGVDARTRSGSESVIDNACGPVQIMADKVVLDGFTIQGSTSSDPCFLAGIWTNPGFSGTQGGHQILNNIIQNNITGIELDNTGTFPTLVQHNLIQTNNNPGPGSGNGIQVNFGLVNATIDANKFSGHVNSSFLIAGVPSSGLTVSNNELVGGTPERIVWGSVTNSTITGNTSVGSTATNGTVRLFGGNSNISITNNVLKNGIRGIRVDDPFTIGPNSGITAHNNCITGNTVAGLEVATGGHTGTLDAKSNWWGAASGPKYNGAGPGTGDNIIDPGLVVAYIPFLTSTTGTPCAPPPIGPPTNANQCKNDGWKTFNAPRTFKNQGDCIQYVNTGK
jgi:hypothetical protein